jgi:hypothetical protein
VAEQKIDVDEVWGRLVGARQAYERAREQLRNLELGVNRVESGQKKQELIKMYERQRVEATEDISTCMLIYQEAARARDAESSAQLTTTNLEISKGMKRWTVAIVIATAIQAVTAVIQTYFSVKGCH